MAEPDPNTALLQTILDNLRDLRERIARVEAMSSEQGAQISALVTEVDHMGGRLDEWIERTEPVTKAYADVPKVLRGVVATCSVVTVVVVAWWSGGIASVFRFLHQPPVVP